MVSLELRDWGGTLPNGSLVRHCCCPPTGVNRSNVETNFLVLTGTALVMCSLDFGSKKERKKKLNNNTKAKQHTPGSAAIHLKGQHVSNCYWFMAGDLLNAGEKKDEEQAEI